MGAELAKPIIRGRHLVTAFFGLLAIGADRERNGLAGLATNQKGIN
jgi:hypothetical protein